MTGAGSGYIDNGCVLNPFAGIPPLYLHGSFPFIETRSVPLCTVTIQPESNPFYNILASPRFILLTAVSQHSMPKARLFFLQSSIAACLSCQEPLTLAVEKSSSPTLLESVFFAAFLPGPTVNPIGRKIINLPIQDVSEGNKNN